MAVSLFPELWILVMENVEDWKIRLAFGYSVPVSTLSARECMLLRGATAVDVAILTGDLALVKKTQGCVSLLGLEACGQYGYIPVLDYLLDQGLIARLNPHRLLAEAAIYGREEVLEWVKQNKKALKISRDDTVIDYASMNGHVHILDWWRENTHDFTLYYSRAAMDGASACGHTKVLQWWRTSPFPLRYSIIALEDASENGHVDVLEWWANSGLKMLYIGVLRDEYSTEVRRWWQESGLLDKGGHMRHLWSVLVDVYDRLLPN